MEGHDTAWVHPTFVHLVLLCFLSTNMKRETRTLMIMSIWTVVFQL